MATAAINQQMIGIESFEYSRTSTITGNTGRRRNLGFKTMFACVDVATLLILSFPVHAHTHRK